MDRNNNTSADGRVSCEHPAQRQSRAELAVEIRGFCASRSFGPLTIDSTGLSNDPAGFRNQCEEHATDTGQMRNSAARSKDREAIQKGLMIRAEGQ